MSGVLLALPGAIGGNAAAIDTETLTVGTFIDKYGYYVGYIRSRGTGAISDGVFAGSLIEGLSFTVGANTLSFNLRGEHPNSGWTTMTVGGQPLNRAAASYFVSGQTVWTWTTPTSPFGPNGTVHSVVFT